VSHTSPTVAAAVITGYSIVKSAPDRAAAAWCECALLRDFDANLGWGLAVSAEDELLAWFAIPSALRSDSCAEQLHATDDLLQKSAQTAPSRPDQHYVPGECRP
jgi:hypothetical protein